MFQICLLKCCKRINAQVYKDFLDLQSDMYDMKVFECTHGEFPKELNYDLFIITGSQTFVDDPEEWIETLKELTKRIIYSNRKIVGFCFGHQLIATVLGGLVKNMSYPEFIVKKVHLTQKGIEFFDRRFLSMIFYHIQEVTDFGIMSPLSLDNQSILHYKNNVLTFQGHPEYTINTINQFGEQKIQGGILDSEFISQFLFYFIGKE